MKTFIVTTDVNWEYNQTITIEADSVVITDEQTLTVTTDGVATTMTFKGMSLCTTEEVA